jgi:hypothetical protein
VLQFLPRGYTPDTVVEGKAAAREELRKRWVVLCLSPFHLQAQAEGCS